MQKEDRFVAQNHEPHYLERMSRKFWEDEERDVRPLARCEEKTMEWVKHWQCDTEVQDLKEDMLWMNERLQSLKEGDLEKAARELTRPRRWWDVMDFHPKVPLDLSKDTRGDIVGILGESGQCG